MSGVLVFLMLMVNNRGFFATPFRVSQKIREGGERAAARRYLNYYRNSSCNTSSDHIKQTLLSVKTGGGKRQSTTILEKINDYQEKHLEPPPLELMEVWGRDVLRVATSLDGSKSCRQEWKLWRRQVKKLRNSLILVSSKKGDGRATSGARRRLSLPAVFRHPAWVSADLGFIRMKGHNYGQFFLAIQTLTNRVFVTKIPNKQWPSLREAVERMFKTQGFEQTTRMLMDGEAAFSEKNVSTLSKHSFRVIRIWPDSGRMAYQAERAIRTFKSVISDILYIKRHHLKDWSRFIKQAVTIMNRQALPINISSPTSLVNFYQKSPKMKAQFYGIPEPTDYQYAFKIGDIVVLKSKAAAAGGSKGGKAEVFGVKRSLVGYDEGRDLTSKDRARASDYHSRITARKLQLGGGRIGGGEGVVGVPIYKIAKSRNWYPETDLVQRL